jgi:hypothetical protein
MDGFDEILVILGMFFLRLGVPILISIVIGYLLRRLDDRWEAEAQQEAIQRKKLTAARKACWEEKGCSEERRARCPASRVTDIPCWLARMRAENRLPALCTSCPRYTDKTTTATRPATQTVRT